MKLPSFPMLHVNTARLHQRLADLAAIGALPNGGVERLAFSDEDKAGRDWVEREMRRLGLKIKIDRIGNLLGVWDGAEADLQFVLAGSHTDTVGNAGRFDGSLGVVAALEAVERMKEEAIKTRHPVGVLVFANEEGVRFQPDMMGSLIFTGAYSVEAARRRVGTDGAGLGAELDRTGYGGPEDFSDLPVRAFVELHIEQGPVLEEEGKTIGVVEAVQGLVWTRLVFRGAANHAGTTPMNRRRDAGYAAGAVTMFARQLAADIGGDQRATVGTIRLKPGLVNVIAEEAEVVVDLRNPDAALLDEAVRCLYRFVDELAEAEGLSVERETLAEVPPVFFDPDVADAIEAAAEALGLPHRRLTSGAGHDAQIVGRKHPAAMIFVPSSNGISHNPAEYTAPEHVEAGANVLLHTLLRLSE